MTEATLHFPIAEYQRRIAKTRKAMLARNLDLIVVSDPSNMEWLTGYNGWSFYVHQAVLLGLEGEPMWWGRGMDANGAKRTRAAAADVSKSPSAPPSIPAQRDMLALMLLIRTFEDAAAREYTRGNVAGFLHLYNGCEASGVGVLSAIRPDDFAMGNYRDHGHALARGVPANALMAELFGKVDGVCKGRGGSMHFFSKEHNYLGGWAIVGGSFWFWNRFERRQRRNRAQRSHRALAALG